MPSHPDSIEIESREEIEITRSEVYCQQVQVSICLYFVFFFSQGTPHQHRRQLISSHTVQFSTSPYLSTSTYILPTYLPTLQPHTRECPSPKKNSPPLHHHLLLSGLRSTQTPSPQDKGPGTPLPPGSGNSSSTGPRTRTRSPSCSGTSRTRHRPTRPRPSRTRTSRRSCFSGAGWRTSRWARRGRGRGCMRTGDRG